MASANLFDRALIERYDTSGPRYTSYPTAVQFHDNFSVADYAREAARGTGERPLSLYVHIPFCARVCYYCACNRIITANRQRSGPYLTRLRRELALQARLFDRTRPVEQLHWGGGTPTFLSADEMRGLMAAIGEHFPLLDNDRGEYSIEIDPREADADTIALLRELGFNRLSLGVQDIDPAVQQAINRVQPLALTESVVQAARAANFRSISLDLIYGLPRQSVAGFDRTLDAVIALQPDRLSVFNYAHLPQLFKTQRQIDAGELPTPAVKLALLQRIIERLTGAGYVYIGMDHFARPDDELAQAQRAGTLHRNFQGYSTHADCDLIGLGLTAIGKVGASYSQNAKTLDAYYGALDRAELPLMRGVLLSHDDRLRRAVINQLICHFQLNFTAIEDRFSIRFNRYFGDELRRLEAMALDGLIDLSVDRIVVRPAGRLLIRNICMVFDGYLQHHREQRFSRAI